MGGYPEGVCWRGVDGEKEGRVLKSSEGEVEFERVKNSCLGFAGERGEGRNGTGNSGEGDFLGVEKGGRVSLLELGLRGG